MSEVTPDLLLRAYAAGIFPMAESADAAELRWVEPRFRGVLPLDGFHCPRSLRKLVRRGAFEVTADRAFAAVITGCAQPRPGRESTWINAEIRSLYTALHAMGRAHSVECWKDGALVGGLYGVSLGAAFFGESMFSLARDASKVALVHLVARLRRAEFALLDAQFLTDHLARFGAIELPRRQYKRLLSAALEREARFPRNLDAAGEAELARLVGGEAAAER